MKRLAWLFAPDLEARAMQVDIFLSANNVNEVIGNADAMRDAILNCAQAEAAALHTRLTTFRETSPVASYAVSSLVYATRGNGRMTKILAVLHQAGFEIGNMTTLAYEDASIRGFAGYLDDLRASNHRRLEALRLEPDPPVLLARPWWGDFYGRNAARFPGDISIWQRFLQPVFDPRFGGWAILTWSLIGGIFGAVVLRGIFSF